MGVAKVVLNGDTLIDTTGKTVAADKMLATYTALDKAGNNVTGNIATKSSSDLTVSGATVTAPAGFYASAASKSVSSMTLPTSTSTTFSGTSKATITPSTSAQYINIPTGYNSSAAYYKINAMTALTLPTSASSSATSGYTLKATITPSTSDQYLNIATGYNSTTSYYKISAMTAMTLPTSASASATSGYTSKATIGRSTSDQYINIPTGYNASGAYYKVSKVTNMTLPSEPTTSGFGTKVGSIEPHTGGSTYYLNIPVGYNEAMAYYEIPTISTLTFPTSTSSGYVGTQQAVITPSSSIQYLNIGTGYNSSNIHYKINAMPTGTAGTPTATKGTVSNHQVSVTPSVTNTTGYITGSTKTGTAVTVTASELASGNKEITSNGTGIDVVGYSTVSVAVSSGPTYTCTVTQGYTYYSDSSSIAFNGNSYKNTGDTGEFHAGDTMTVMAFGSTGIKVVMDGVVVEQSSGSSVIYSFTAPAHDIEVSFSLTEATVSGKTISITKNGTYDVLDYKIANVNVKAPKYTAKILTTGNSTNAVVQFNGINYYTIGDTIDYDAGDTLTIHCRGTNQPYVGRVIIDGVEVAQSANGVTYNYTLPSNNIEITFNTSTPAQFACIVKSAPILDFETGTYTPESDIAQPTINFANSHDTLPMYVAIGCTDPSVYASDLAANTNIAWMFSDFSQAGDTIVGVPSSSSQTIYARYQYWYRGSTAGGAISSSGGNIVYPITDTTSSNNAYPRYYVTETGFRPYSSSTSRYWRSGYTYKWIAVWR